ncbi:MAG: hypothetical protein JNK87_33260 [Bryobacterales bacterium]|nr:hypothetical protein [Bryobacterales bacterium]
MRTTLIPLMMLLTACGGRSDRLTVGAKNFTEQLILGEIVAQHLEKRVGQPVDRKFNLGGALLAQTALTSGQIDLLPEYTGTALTTVLKLPPNSSPGETLQQVREGYKQWHLEWLDPLGFNNTFAMVVRKADADRLNIRTLSEAANAQPWKLGVGYEFLTRPDGWPGLQKAYALRMDGNPTTMDLGLLYAALRSGRVDLAAANSTDGLLATGEFTVLEDDRSYFPPYQAAIVARGAALTPEVRKALNELSGAIDDTVMRRLNYEVAGRQRQATEVAREFLASKR